MWIIDEAGTSNPNDQYINIFRIRFLKSHSYLKLDETILGFYLNIEFEKYMKRTNTRLMFQF